MCDLQTKKWRIKNGNPIHDGDCRYWGQSICTCGLLHHLRWLSDMPDWAGKEMARQDLAMSEFLTSPIAKANQDAALRRKELLKRLQWESNGPGGDIWCVGCQGYKSEGCAPDCELAKELSDNA